MLAQLERFVARQMPGESPEIVGLTNTSLGRSRENWSFDLVWHGGDRERVEPLILRRDPIGGLVETERSREFAILQGLEASPVPAPVPRWLDARGEWFGRPSLIMRRAPGSCEYYVLTGSRPLEERLGLAGRFCDLLAQVHQVKWRDSVLAQALDDPGEHAAQAQIDEWETTLHREQPESYPELDLTAQWLRATAPLAQTTVLVHGDFKPGNVLLEGDRIVALLDWELAHLGDPLEDLGWVTQPLRRREHVIPGVWEDQQILERYEEQTGFTLSEEAIKWWNVFATFRTAVMQVSGLRSFLEGRSAEPYRPTARVLRSLVEAIEG